MNSGTLDIKKYDEMGTETKVFKLTTTLDLSPFDWNTDNPVQFLKVKKFNVKGRIEVKDFWTTFELTGDRTNIQSLPFTLELKSSSPKLNIFKVSATVKPAASNSGTGRLSLDVKFNDKTLNYESKMITTDDSIKASSTVNTNIEQFGFAERKSNYELTKTKKRESNGMLHTYVLKYQQEDDGAKKIDVQTEVTTKFSKFSRVSFKTQVYWPELLNSQDKIQAAWEVSGKPGQKASLNFKLTFTFGDKNLRAKFETSRGTNRGGRYSRTDLLIKPTNMPSFVPTVKGQLRTKEKAEYTDTTMRQNEEDGYFKVNNFEIFRFKTYRRCVKDSSSGVMNFHNIWVEPTFFGKTKQKLEFKFVKDQYEDFEHQVLLQATGTNKFTNGKIDLKWTSKAYEGKAELLIDGFTVPDYDTVKGKIGFFIPSKI